MNNKAQINKMSKRIVIIVTILGVISVVALYLYVSKTDLKKREITSRNKDNTATLRAEKDQAPVIMDDKVSIDSQNNKQDSPGIIPNESPTIDSTGLSTNLNRAEVRPAVVAVLATYQDFLAQLQAVPMSQRQAVADRYLASHRAMFSSGYGYLSSDNLHLFPQSAGVEIPGSVSVNSAIVDPDNPTQTIVQVFMQPDNSWSLLVYVKMNANGELGTFENLVVRNSQNPL